MIFGPFLCSRLLQLRTISVAAGTLQRHRHRKRKRQLNFLFFVFIDHRFPRFGRKYCALLSLPLPCRVIEYEQVSVPPLDYSLPLPCRVIEYEQVSALPFDFPCRCPAVS